MKSLLKINFQGFFSICSSREAKLRQGGEWNNNLEWTWKIGWRRSLFDWEKHQEQELVMLMGRKTINEENEDLWVWKESVKVRGKALLCMRGFGGLRHNHQLML